MGYTTVLSRLSGGHLDALGWAALHHEVSLHFHMGSFDHFKPLNWSLIRGREYMHGVSSDFPSRSLPLEFKKRV